MTQLDQVRALMPVSEELEYSAEFSPGEYYRITMGLPSTSMDEKWNMLFADDLLTMHRSWTRICIYAIEFEKRGINFAANRAWVNRDPQKSPLTSPAFDCALIEFLIRALLLRQPIEFPRPSDWPVDDPKGALQHHIAGTAHPERKLDDEPR